MEIQYLLLRLFERNLSMKWTLVHTLNDAGRHFSLSFSCYKKGVIELTAYAFDDSRILRIY